MDLVMPAWINQVMTPEVTLLLGFALLTIVLPVLWAFWSVFGPPLPPLPPALLNRWDSLKLRLRLLFAAGTDREVIEIELQFQKLLAGVTDLRIELAISQHSEVELKASLEGRLLAGPDGKDTSALLEKLDVQRRKSAELNEKLEAAESDVQRAYSRRQVLVAITASDKASKLADEVLYRTKLDNTIHRIETFEKKISETEKQANILPILKGLTAEDIEQLDLGDIEELCKTLSNSICELKAPLDSLLVAITDIELDLKKAEGSVDQWTRRFNLAQQEDEQEIVDAANFVKEGFLSASEELRELLKQLNKSKGILEKRLREIEPLSQKFQERQRELQEAESLKIRQNGSEL